MTLKLRVAATASALLSAMPIGGPALAQKPGGILRMCATAGMTRVCVFGVFQHPAS